MKKLIAEFIGTLWLVLGGCGSAVLAASYPELGIGFVGVAIAFVWPSRLKFGGGTPNKSNRRTMFVHCFP